MKTWKIKRCIFRNKSGINVRDKMNTNMGMTRFARGAAHQYKEKKLHQNHLIGVLSMWVLLIHMD